MSVLVKLPETITGKELSDAIEKAGKEIGWLTTRAKEVYYEPGSVKTEEFKSTLTIRKPKLTKAKKSRRFLGSRFGKPEDITNIAEPSHTYFRIEVPAEEKFNSIKFSTFVEVEKWYSPVPGSFPQRYYESSEVATSDPRFVEQIQPDFEKFLAILFGLLKPSATVASA